MLSILAIGLSLVGGFAVHWGIGLIVIAFWIREYIETEI
jgi:hypothetical protein